MKKCAHNILMMVLCVAAFLSVMTTVGYAASSVNLPPLHGKIVINIIYLEMPTVGYAWDSGGMGYARLNVDAVKNWMEVWSPEELNVSVVVKEYGPVALPNDTVSANGAVSQLTYTEGGQVRSYIDILDFNRRTRDAENAYHAITYVMVNDAGQSLASLGDGWIKMYYWTDFVPYNYNIYLHEALHLFGALDEYLTIPGVSNGSDCGEMGQWGYVNDAYNANCLNNTLLWYSIMKCSEFCNDWASPTTLGMIGWLDRDGDGVYDPKDHCPDDAGSTGGDCLGCPAITCASECDKPLCDGRILKPYCGEGSTCLNTRYLVMAGEICTDADVCSDYYRDWDLDTFGNPENMARIADKLHTVPEGWVLDNTDCDDFDMAVYPGAEEVCDGVDTDCNGMDDFLGYDDSETDVDGDGIYLCNDNCPSIANPLQGDVDNDGAGDECDVCPNDPLDDNDADGACADVDNCPDLANASQADQDNDGMGDACDICPLDGANDMDGDSFCADVDNCPMASNVDQLDYDEDGLGNACDSCPADPENDVDGDTVCGDIDNCASMANADQSDLDGDGVGDVCDVCPNDADDDIDGDGVCGDVDNCPNIANASQLDLNNDGVGNACGSSDGGCFLNVLRR